MPKEPNRDRATAEAGTQAAGDGTQVAREVAAEGATQAAAESATTSTATPASASAISKPTEGQEADSEQTGVEDV